MKTLIKKFFDNEILSYLFFGVATTIVSVGTRLFIYHVSRDERLATAIGNIAGILFAFATNDTIVFKQERKGWFQRLIRFAIARSGTFILDMALTEIFVKQFPGIIGQFVHNNKSQINLIETLFAQVAIVVLNYVFSKLFVFKNKNKAWNDCFKPYYFKLLYLHVLHLIDRWCLQPQNNPWLDLSIPAWLFVPVWPAPRWWLQWLK